MDFAKGLNVGKQNRDVLLTPLLGGLLLLLAGCQTDHGRNCQDLCEELVQCSWERACQYVVDKDARTCRKNCAEKDGTYHMRCTACLATEFSCEEPVSEECVEACMYSDFVGTLGGDGSGEYPPGEWFCDGEPLVSGR